MGGGGGGRGLPYKRLMGRTFWDLFVVRQFVLFTVSKRTRMFVV